MSETTSRRRRATATPSPTSATSARATGFRKIRKEPRRHRVRRQRDRAAALLRDRQPLPRRAGGALLPAQRPDRDRVRRRHRATSSSRAASPGSTPRPSARSATSATREDAIYVVVGGKDGYVGRDGKPARGRDRARLRRRRPTPGDAPYSGRCSLELLVDPGHHVAEVLADLLDLVPGALLAHARRSSRRRRGSRRSTRWRTRPTGSRRGSASSPPGTPRRSPVCRGSCRRTRRCWRSSSASPGSPSRTSGRRSASARAGTRSRRGAGRSRPRPGSRSRPGPAPMAPPQRTACSPKRSVSHSSLKVVSMIAARPPPIPEA